VDSSGSVYVADSLNGRVQQFMTNGFFISKWGSNGTADGQFNTPVGVAVDSSGNVYVADTGNHRIQKFSSDGSFLTKWGTDGGQVGYGDGEFSWPNGIAVDGSGNVYVADQNNNRVQKFSSDGRFITKWGSPGTDYGQFVFPDGIAVDSFGNVYVTDSLPPGASFETSTAGTVTRDNRVQEFSPGPPRNNETVSPQQHSQSVRITD
jgi:sugar lactone lactonase YvrE